VQRGGDERDALLICGTDGRPKDGWTTVIGSGPTAPGGVSA
jgi:hypothetical protein